MLTECIREIFFANGQNVGIPGHEVILDRSTPMPARLKRLIPLQTVLLAEAEEREREFEEEKKLFSGSFGYEKIQQYNADLSEERQNVSRLQEQSRELEKKRAELESANSCLQKKLAELQNRHKNDGEERKVGARCFSSSLLYRTRNIYH